MPQRSKGSQKEQAYTQEAPNKLKCAETKNSCEAARLVNQRSQAAPKQLEEEARYGNQKKCRMSDGLQDP